MKRLVSNHFLMVVGIPLLAALASRLILLQEWWSSPFRLYYLVAGLDMETNFRFGKMLYNNQINFSLHRLLVAIPMWLTRGTPNPDAVVMAQLFLGIPVGAMTGWIAFRLSRSRWWALTSGLLAGCYSALLLHECFLGKDSMTVVFATLSLFLLIWAQKWQFRGWTLPLAGIGLVLPCLVHISACPFAALGFLWLAGQLFRQFRKTSLSKFRYGFKILILLIAVLGTFMIGGVYNFFFCNGSLLPLSLPNHYFWQVLLLQPATPLQIPAPQPPPSAHAADTPAPTASFISRLSVKSCGIAQKWLKLFQPYEIPNNVNHYFVKSRLPLLEFMPGPLLVIPPGVIGLLLLLWNRRWRRRFLLPTLFLLCYSVPLAVFYPLARYRLLLVLVFCLAAPYVIWLSLHWYRQHRRAFLLPLLASVLYGLLLFPGFSPDLLRAADFVAYGKAQQYQGNPAAAERSYYQALTVNPKHLQAVASLASLLLQRGAVADAATLLAPYHRDFPEAESITYYYALTLLGQGHPGPAGKLLESLSVPIRDQAKTEFFYYRGECARLTGNTQAAIRWYRDALLNATPSQQQILHKLLNQLSSSQSLK